MKKVLYKQKMRKMVEIASNYHKQLQEKPQMNAARRRAITQNEETH